MNPYAAVLSIIASMMMMAFGNGLMGTFIPIRLSLDGYGAAVSGSVVTAYSIGMLLGCVLSGWTVRRVGHIRAFAAFASLSAALTLALPALENPPVWIVIRALSGFCTTAVFMLAQSWLNELTPSAHRGRIMAFFYVSFTVAYGLGPLLITKIDTGSLSAFMVTAGAFAMAVNTVTLTRARTPSVPERIRIDFKGVYRMSPVALVGVFAAGFLAMTLQSTGAIYGGLLGLAPASIALLMTSTQAGNLAIQWPLGWLSDKIDRRTTILAASGIACTSSIFLAAFGNALPFAVLLTVFAAYAGASESLYSMSAAHANDHVQADGDFVAVSSTLLVTWSIGATIGPLFATASMDALGSRGLFIVLGTFAIPFALFVTYRKIRREAPPETEQEEFLATPIFTPAAPDAVTPPDESAR